MILTEIFISAVFICKFLPAVSHASISLISPASTRLYSEMYKKGVYVVFNIYKLISLKPFKNKINLVLYCFRFFLESASLSSTGLP
jgi:hypothetical protein